jgi:Tfp pilus assembly protein PilF
MRAAKRQRGAGPAISTGVVAQLLDAGAAHLAAGRLAEARGAYAAAARADPADFRAPMSLATLDLRQGRPDLALTWLRRVVALRPGLFDAHHNLAAAAQALQLWEEAADAWARALELRPDAVEARRNLAVALTVLGRLEEAEGHHRRLAAHPSTRLWALTRLALLKPGEVTDAELADMQAAAADAAVEPDTRIGLCFGLGEALERRGRDDAAFEAFAAGNRLKRAALAADPATAPDAQLQAHRAAARRVEQAFGAEALGRLGGRGLATSAPIFVVGMPRSGSTLIEQILSSHPDVLALGETAALPRLLERGELVGPTRPEAPRRLARAYLEAVRARGWRGVGRFVDKTLENYLHVGAIAAMFPRAVILHAVRDPVDTCLSCYRQLFAEGAETLYDLADIGAEYVVYRQVMAHWGAVLPGRVIEVDHEALVGDPEDRIRWLVTEACGLAWDDACLAFHARGGAVQTASSAQVRQPIFRTSLQRWRRYERHLGPLLAALQALSDS